MLQHLPGWVPWLGGIVATSFVGYLVTRVIPPARRAVRQVAHRLKSATIDRYMVSRREFQELEDALKAKSDLDDGTMVAVLKEEIEGMRNRLRVIGEDFKLGDNLLNESMAHLQQSMGADFKKLEARLNFLEAKGDELQREITALQDHLPTEKLRAPTQYDAAENTLSGNLLASYLPHDE